MAMVDENLAPDIISGAAAATVAVVSPVLGIPAAAAAPIIRRTVERLMRHGVAILEEQVGDTAIDPEDVDQVRLAWRYNTLVMEGFPDFNLRLVAQLVAHAYTKGPFTRRSADDYITVLRDLSPQELVVIATLHRIGKHEERAFHTWREAGEVLVPKPFSSQDDLKAAAAQAVRSGLLITESSGTLRGGGTSYRSSPLMGDLETLPAFQKLMEDPYADI